LAQEPGFFEITFSSDPPKLLPMTNEIYLDANATTAVLPAAVAAAQHAMAALYGNPSSSHSTGLVARAMMESVRARAARLLGTGQGDSAGRLLFVSGATEGIQTAVLSALVALRERRARGEAVGNLLLYGATDHKAVPESLAHWNDVLALGFEVHALPVGQDGRHDLDVLRALAPQAAMVCTMAANNETGVISDLAGIERVLVQTQCRAYWLVDCVQALGKLPLNLAATRIDYAPFSGHKLYAPKGIGMLYVRAGSPFTPLMAGGGQEGGQRSGTENMAGIAALGAVLAALETGNTFRTMAQLKNYQNSLVARLKQAFPAIVFNTPLDQALPTTINFSVPGLPSQTVLNLFDAGSIRVSSGSACSAAKAEPSFVLVAMNLPEWQTTSAVRLSFGPLVDEAFVAAACAAIDRCGEAARSSGLLLPQPDSSDATDADPAESDSPPAPEVSVPELQSFFARHPSALLIDVREAYEHAAADPWAVHGHVARNVPLSQLAVPGQSILTDRERALVLFCRSGNRSRKAAQWLLQAGHKRVWHIAGGLALATSSS
jgi:cysteine desulfurase